MAARNSVKLTVTEGYSEWGDHVVAGIMRRLDAVLPEAGKAAASLEVPYQTGDLRNSIHVLPASREGDHIQAAIGASDYKANWYEQGTGARRSKAIKHSRTRKQAADREGRRKAARAAGSTAGVKPLHFLRKGLYAMRTVVFHEIGEAMRNGRSGL